MNENLKFLADKVNINYEDLQEEICHFARSYKTIIKSTKILFENEPNYKDDLISEFNTDEIVQSEQIEDESSDDNNDDDKSSNFSKSKIKKKRLLKKIFDSLILDILNNIF